MQPECDITNNLAQITLNLQSEPTYILVTACDHYDWYGQTYTQSGQYETTIPNAYGCDSTLILTLTIGDIEIIELPSVTECDAYEWHGQTYTESGTYTYDTLNTFGCQTQYVLPLTISHNVEYEFSVTSCQPYEWYGTVYDEPGTYTQMLTSSQGCDSLLILNLTISDSEIIELSSVTECDTYTWYGQTYTESGTYTYDTLNSSGCPIQYILPLTIGHSTEYEFSVTSCQPYEWYGTVYDEPGTYTQLLTNSQGCDSLLSLNLTVSLSSEGCIHGPTTIFPSTNLVLGVYPYYIDSTNLSDREVHWSIDRDDWLLIPHGASCDLVCLTAGEGILHAWTEGDFCNLDTTMVVNALFFEVGEDGSSLKLYPNPTQGKVTVEWEEIQAINVYDLMGQKLMLCEYGKEQICILDLNHWRHGVYFLEIVSSTGRVIRPVVLTR